MKKAVESLKKYIETYDKQMGYLDYADQTFIDDVLYGLGVALRPKQYAFSDGFRRFKELLLDHLACDGIALDTPDKKDAKSKTKTLVRKVTAKWSKRQRLCREWLASRARGEGASSCCIVEAYEQVVLTLDQCKRELKEAADAEHPAP